MSNTGIISLLLLILNVIISIRGFNNPAFFDRYKFEVDRILVNREYIRLISSGFLHVNWLHLIFNTIALGAFSGMVEGYLGSFQFLLVYFASLIGGDLLCLFIHRNHGDYSAVGASGAICGVIFASIAIFPGMSVGLFFLPISLPGWLFGLVFVLFSIYGIKSSRDNIGHDAHLGGALVGMLVGILFDPGALTRNSLTIAVILVPTLIFIYLILTRPHILLIDNYFFKQHQKYYNIDHKYNADRVTRQQEIDRILEKISKSGMKSLSKKEKDALDQYSRGV
jgi:membrane associated rhomboid family serine protease